MMAMEFEDMIHLRLLATSFPSSESTNLWLRCSCRVSVLPCHSGLQRSVAAASTRGLPWSSPEDGAVELLSKVGLVVEEDEVPHLVQVQEDGVGVLPVDGPAFDNHGYLRHLCHVSRPQCVSQVLGEPACMFHRVEEVDRGVGLLVFAHGQCLLQPEVVVECMSWFQFVVVFHAFEDIAVVFPPPRLLEFFLELRTEYEAWEVGLPICLYVVFVLGVFPVVENVLKLV